MSSTPSSVAPSRRLVRGFKVWSSAPDDPRLRRPTDVLLLVVTVVLGTAIAITFRATAPPAATTPTESTIVDVVRWSAEAVYDVLTVWTVVLVLLTLLTRGRRRLVLDFVCGIVLSVAAGLLVARPSTGGWTETLEQSMTASPTPVSVLAPIAMCTAIIVIASPHVTRPLRWTGRLLILLGAGSATLLDIVQPLGGVAAIVCGVFAAAVTHLMLGTPSGHATPDQVRDSLPEIGVDAVWVALADRQRPGYSVFDAIDDGGRDLVVKVYGRDAWDEQFVGSVWTAMTRKGETLELFGGRRSHIDREAIVSLLAERAGVPVLPVVATGVTDDGDAMMVTEAPAQVLGLLPTEELTQDHLAAAWRTLASLHALGIAHRDVDLMCFALREDGSMAITDLADARTTAETASLMVDRVRLLVATAVATDHDRALAGAVDALGGDGVAEMLPYLQSAVLDHETRRAIEDGEWSINDLRSAAVDVTGVEAPELLQLQRVSWKSVGLVVLVGIMAYAIIGLLSGVDFASIKEQISGADKAWLWLALAMSPIVQVFLSFSTLGAAMERLRYIPVLMLQYAVQFISLTLPSTAARLALEVRFFQKFGIPAGGAVSIGMIDSFSGFLVQITLLLIILLGGLPGFTAPIRGSSSESSSSDSSTSSGPSSLAILLVVLIVVGILATVFVPRFRRRLVGFIPRVRQGLREQTGTAKTALRVVRHPVKVVTMLAGNLGTQVWQALILGVCLYAFGQHTAHLSQLILINTAASLFGGLMPVPGSMGVAEAAYTAGLQAIGIPSSVAISTAIAFRMVTFYLPPIWGAAAMRWMRKNDYV
jgi:uncharacterized membrane protein YbhN (UPF0104 family)